MTTEDNENQLGGAPPNDASANASGNDEADAVFASAVSENSTPGTASPSAAGDSTTDTPDKSMSQDDHHASAHAALRNLARDFKQLGLDFEAATKAAWEAEFANEEQK